MTIPAEKVTQLIAAYNYSPVLALVTGDLSSYTFTANASTDVITATGHDFVNGTPIRFSNVSGSLPGGLNNNTTYYVVNAATNTFKIAATVGGTAINIVDAGSGTHTVTEQAIADILAGNSGFNSVLSEQQRAQLYQNYADASIVWDVMVRHEVPSYQGSARQSFTWGTPVLDAVGNADMPLVTVNIIPTTGNITFRYMVILRGGNTTLGNGMGSVAICKDMGGITIGTQGYSFTFDVSQL